MSENRLHLFVKRREREIRLADLVFAEAHNREIIFYLLDEEVRGYYRIEELEKELPSNFFRCHRSYIVNMNFIDHIDGADVVMITDDRIPLPRRKRKLFMETLKKYDDGIGVVHKVV